MLWNCEFAWSCLEKWMHCHGAASDRLLLYWLYGSLTLCQDLPVKLELLSELASHEHWWPKFSSTWTIWGTRIQGLHSHDIPGPLHCMVWTKVKAVLLLAVKGISELMNITKFISAPGNQAGVLPVESHCFLSGKGRSLQPCFWNRLKGILLVQVTFTDPPSK